MERLTKKLADGTYEIANGQSANVAIQKLAKFENMYEALCTEQRKTIEDLEKLRISNKTKTVTYKQLLANKMLIMNLLSRFDIYGLKGE